MQRSPQPPQQCLCTAVNAGGGSRHGGDCREQQKQHWKQEGGRAEASPTLDEAWLGCLLLVQEQVWQPAGGQQAWLSTWGSSQQARRMVGSNRRSFNTPPQLLQSHPPKALTDWDVLGGRQLL
jgi:hypothetical protein